MLPLHTLWKSESHITAPAKPKVSYRLNMIPTQFNIFHGLQLQPFIEGDNWIQNLVLTMCMGHKPTIISVTIVFHDNNSTPDKVNEK